MSREFSVSTGLLLVALSLVGCQSPMNVMASPSDDPDGAQRLELPDTIYVESQAIRVGASPAVGRIVEVSPHGGEDFLWRMNVESAALPSSGWVNYGGDKVWPTVQGHWPILFGRQWPPDGVIDGKPWSVMRDRDRTLVMRSPVSPHLDIELRRQIDIESDTPALTVSNTITRIEPNVMPVTIWSVTQLVQPECVLLEQSPLSPSGTGLEAVTMSPRKDPAEVRDRLSLVADGRAVRWDFGHAGGAKIGTLGRWIAAVYPDKVLVQATMFDPDGSFPDRSNLQAYTDGAYTEAEVLSPQAHLLVGQTLSNQVHWWVLDRSDETDAELVETIISRLAGDETIGQ